MTADFFHALQGDLQRPHPFAAERVAFAKARVGRIPGGIVLLPYNLISVPDDGYLPVKGFGATIGEEAIRGALQMARTEHVSMIHVHMHDHLGQSAFSPIDEEESARFMPPFTHVRPDLPHAAVVMSQDSLIGRCWRRGWPPDEILEATIVGPTIRRFHGA